jgi:adenylate cyclase
LDTRALTWLSNLQRLSASAAELLYGNIGAVERLDFTVIGPAVNLTARIENLTRSLQSPLVVSGGFAAHHPDKLTSAGFLNLKGFNEPIEVFTPKTNVKPQQISDEPE